MQSEGDINALNDKLMGQEKKLRFFQSIVPYRLIDEGETFEEFKFRQKIVNKQIKEYLRGRKA